MAHGVDQQQSYVAWSIRAAEALSSRCDPEGLWRVGA